MWHQFVPLKDESKFGMMWWREPWQGFMRQKGVDGGLGLGAWGHRLSDTSLPFLEITVCSLGLDFLAMINFQ